MNIPDETLQEISDLAKTQVDYEKRIEQLESTLSELKDKLRNVSEVLIPEAMLSVGMESFKLSDGTSVKIEKYYAGKIPEDKQDEAFAWLRQTGNDSLIKREVKCQFGKGEDQEAQIAIQALQDLGLNPTDKASVHPMTLKSFIRENVEGGKEFPMELFGAFIGNRTKIAPAKKA